jgi:dihydrofolate reductase
MDPEIDFKAMFSRFDTMLVGRGTYEASMKYGGGGMPGMKTYVFSQSLRPQDHPKVTVVTSERAKETLTSLKKSPGKDIWLMGGGKLFRSLLDLKMVDTVETAIIPVLLGAGIPLLPPPGKSIKLQLVEQRLYEKTGTVWVEYAVK